MTISTVVFDLDGTLIDTEPAAAFAISEAFRRWGVPVSGEDAAYITGRTWASAFEYLFKKYPVPIPEAEAAHEMLSEYRKALRTQLHIVPGSVEAVRAIAETYQIGLVSGSHRSEVIWALERLGVKSLFQTILAAEDYSLSKPDPAGYNRAMTLMNVTPERVLIFEDSQAGIASAKASGAWVVAITGTNHFRQDTSAAHHSIKDLTGVDAKWVRIFEQTFAG